MALRDTSVVWKIIVVAQIIGLALTLAGFGSNYILSYSNRGLDVHAGLWKTCANDNCQDTDDVLKGAGEDKVWLDASKGLMSIALAVEFITIVMTLAGVFVTLTKMLGWCSAVAAIFSAVVGVVGIAVAAGEGKRTIKNITGVTLDPDWSFIVFMIGQGIFLLAAILHVLDSKTRPR